MLNRLFSGHTGSPRLRLVVGLNQVDKLGPWNVKLNLPEPPTEELIGRKGGDIAAKLVEQTGLQKEQIEHYSATKFYRLPHLLARVIRHCFGGFRLDQVEPADPFSLAEPEVREFAERERKEIASKKKAGGLDLMAELAKVLGAAEMKAVQEQVGKERERPPRIALLGKAGVGKTSTINALFQTQANWKVSHTVVGTTQMQAKDFDLASGGKLTAVDLPGYGRSIREDAEYETLYKEVLAECDLVLLVLQATTRDFSDDQEMIGKLLEWLKAAPVPARS